MQNQTKEFGPVEIDNFLNGMNTRFYLSVCLPLLFFVIVFLNLQEKGGISPAFEPDDALWHYLLAAMALITWLWGDKLYKNGLKDLSPELNLSEKLLGFRRASVLKYTIASINCLVIILFLYLTKEQIFLMAFGALLVLLSINRPTPYRIIKDLKLGKEDQKILREYRRHL